MPCRAQAEEEAVSGARRSAAPHTVNVNFSRQRITDTPIVRAGRKISTAVAGDVPFTEDWSLNTTPYPTGRTCCTLQITDILHSFIEPSYNVTNNTLFKVSYSPGNSQTRYIYLESSYHGTMIRRKCQTY